MIQVYGGVRKAKEVVEEYTVPTLVMPRTDLALVFFVFYATSSNRAYAKVLFV
jgi:hypothetical protein